ncbi:MAG: sugar phosphate isomerase/epimerase [Saprospiraceae bacterium]|nr:sugar phosphate isomerase/epimerase [Saprospiraceae bacterium]
MSDLERLCIHTITTKPWSLPEALDEYSKAGVGGVSVWQNAIEPFGPTKASQILRDYPVEVVSYVRGGFFPALESTKRQRAIDHNRKLIDEAAEINAPLLVLVCGADPQQSLTTSRDQIRAGIEAILPHARANNVRLAIEPLHPMYADTRSAINTLAQANDMAEKVADDHVGIAVDVYHLWWDSDLQNQIQRCGEEGNLLAFHICDWKYPTEDMLNDRGLMGEGCIPVKEISSWVKTAGFTGWIEVEIFSNHYWSMNQNIFLNKIIDAYQKLSIIK